ncbi:MAG: zinc-dependent metalloprotease family protein [Saprospiraceae bacterium]
MRQFCIFVFAFGLFSSVFAQKNFWIPVKPESITLPAGSERRIQPLQFHTFQLDYSSLKTALSQAPMEFSDAARQQPLLLNLPLADGSLLAFQVWESPLMASELSAKYPEIRNYTGRDAEGLGLIVRLGVSYKGFHAFIISPDGHVQSVRPYAEGSQDFYMAYRQEDLPADPSLPENQHRCGVEGGTGTAFPQNANFYATERGAAPVTLRKYRAAIAAQGEYSQFHGGTKPLVLSAINEALDYLNAIFERDWAIRLELIADNDKIIFLDPTTDPYSGDLVTSWMPQNPAAINQQISSSTYDIGHVFTRVTNTPGGVYVAGIAEKGSVCTQTKARAGSSLPSPTGEGFYLIVAHEMGHQFSADHTFNSCPPADEVNPSTAFEPGGGTTIMSYATTCDPDVVGGRDSYFHVASIEQVTNFITTGDGKNCPENIASGNNSPEVSIPLTNNFYIPIETPFVLNANASDVDGDALTYCWEEYDLGPSSPLGEPVSTAPIFRSFPPTDLSSRTFPRLTSIIFNTQDDAEVLPTYSRELNFKCTVRDNHPGAGGVSIAAVKFFATAQAGPFEITYPNASSDVWTVGEYQTITWDVANTDKAPVNCKTVNIWLSLNNGLTNQIQLAAGVPNNGKYCVQVPNNLSNIARIRIEAADNIFFDISNAGFKIQASATQPDFSICPGVLSDLACAPTIFTTEINTNTIAGFSDPITLEATGIPAGATATFSPNPVTPGSASTLTVDFLGTVVEGPFDLTVSATANGVTKTIPITFNVVQNDFSAFSLQAPADGAQNIDLAPWLYWNKVPDGDTYEIQVASSPSFAPGTILTTSAGITVDSFKIPFLLEEGQVCYWRVRPRNTCGDAAWSEPFVFVTKVQSCSTLSATDLPKTITPNGTPTVESKITVTANGIIGDVNVKKVQGQHSFLQDLDVRLVSPSNTSVLLFLDKCGSYSGSFNIGFDDSANGPFGCPPPTNGALSKPVGQLSNLAGENSAGVWTLRVKDNAISSGGQLIGFELELCSSVALSAPFIVNNNTLQVMPGSNDIIGESLLKVDDANNSASQLLFTLVTAPKFGEVRIAGVTMQPGDQFTQSDVNSGLLRYYDYGFNTGTDDFKFAVTDGEGGLVKGTFTIQPFPVSTNDLLGKIAFSLVPNPASESVRLSVTQSLDSDSRVTLFNTAGQQLRFWALPAGATTLQLDVTNLPEGVYAIAIENEKSRGVRKVVVR